MLYCQDVQSQMADLNALKTQLKEQNQRLLSVTQEKARLEAKNKINQMKEEEGVGKSSFTIIRRAGTWSQTTIIGQTKWTK